MNVSKYVIYFLIILSILELQVELRILTDNITLSAIIFTITNHPVAVSIISLSLLLLIRKYFRFGKVI